MEKSMNKADLISAIVEKTGLTKKETDKTVKAFEEVIIETLAQGGKVQIVGFGTFDVSDRAARVGRNPQTGKEMDIPASKAPRFKAGKVLKDAVNKE